ncbi:MAG: hypothetical protein QM714_12800 [Nocardioides sp.]|uniref:hypothetical protein n=1 Tax=Nocardioides sp. TaxID=35761 RepID=UPI0039E36993
MSRSVYLHIGAPKTGTTYLQDRLSRNADRLADRDVLVPTGSRFVSPQVYQFRAALDLLGEDWGGPPGHADGHWDGLMRKVRRARGSVIISHEILAPASPDKVARVMNDLQGFEVHIVYSARDLARQLPAAWQESIKQGRKWRFRRFLSQFRDGKAWAGQALDLPSVLNTWGAHLPPQQVHVVTVPPTEAQRRRGEELWLRFCRAFDIEPAWAPLDSERANRSLGMAETELIRQLNRRLGRGVRGDWAYDALVLHLLAQRELATREGDPVRLPPKRYPWVEEQAELWIDWLEGSGVEVIGDLADLRPVRPAEDTEWDNPDRVPAASVLDVALQSLEAMTREAARRSDPDRQLVNLVRDRAERRRGH